jgi:hypothetical protein
METEKLRGHVADNTPILYQWPLGIEQIIEKEKAQELTRGKNV